MRKKTFLVSFLLILAIFLSKTAEVNAATPDLATTGKGETIVVASPQPAAVTSPAPQDGPGENDFVIPENGLFYITLGLMSSVIVIPVVFGLLMSQIKRYRI